MRHSKRQHWGRAWLVSALCIIWLCHLAFGSSNDLQESSSSAPVASVHHYAHHLVTEEHRQKLRKLFSRIEDDLGAWKDGITLDMVERTYCTNYPMSFRFQIINGSMYVAGEMEGFSDFNRHVKLMLLEVASQHQLPDLDIVFTTKDFCPWPDPGPELDTVKCPQEAPLFAFDRRREEAQHCVPFPDFTFSSGGWPMARLPAWATAREVFQLEDTDNHAWEKRIPTLFFRGAPTGQRGELENDAEFMQDPRIDFKLTGWTGTTALEEYVSLPAHCKYKYLLHLPGNGWSVRLKYLMMCGSPVIFPYWGLEEFWYHLLEDNVHVAFVPGINGHDRGRLVREALSRLEADPVAAQKLANNAADLIQKILTPETVHRYFAELLRHYAKLQRFTPTLHPDARPFRYSVMEPDQRFTIDTRNCTYCSAGVPVSTNLDR